MKKTLSLLCGLGLAVVTTQAQTIAQWTFENSFAGITGTSASLTGIAAETGTGTASGTHASATTVWSSPAGNGSPHSFSANVWAVGDYFQFQTSTLGNIGIQLDWDQTSSGTGPGKYLLQYSTDGSSFTAFGSDYSILQNGLAPNASWNATTASAAYHFTVDLSTVPALDNASAVYFRLVDDSTISASGGTIGTGGTDRVDNFTIGVVAAPEPASVALFGLGLTALAVLRRRS